MVRIRLRGINKVKRRLADGTRVEYHSIRGAKGSGFWKSTDPVKLGSQDYIAAYQSALRPNKSEGSFGEVIEQFLESNEFRKLAPRTKRDYRKWLDEVRDRFGSAPRSAFEDHRIRATALKWRDRWSGKNADYAWTVLRRVVSWAVGRGILKQHHLRDAGSLYHSNRADIIWTEDEVAAVERMAPVHVARALRAAVETGLRPGDLIGLSKAHVEETPVGRRIKLNTRKRERVASIPVTPKMAEIIDSAPGFLVLTAARNGAWTEENMSKSVKKAARKAEVREELRLYDARGSAVSRLVLSGVTVPELAIHMGWSPRTAAEMIERYAVLDPAMSDAVLAKLQSAGAKPEQNLQNGVQNTPSEQNQT